MNLSDLSNCFGIFGSLAGAGSLFYAWRNDKLARFLPHDKRIDEALSGNENEFGVADRVRAMLQRIKTMRGLRIALSVAKKMHFARPKDDALLQINLRAIELGNLRFAYHDATGAEFAVTLDRMLQNVVFAALNQRDVKLARKCAGRMHFARSADTARKQIIEWTRRQGA